MNSKIDIVIPVFNEVGGLDALYNALTDVVDELPYEFTFIFVNDGSSDGSSTRLHRLAQHDKRILVIDLVRNFGKEIALTAGLSESNGDAAITMDADLQHPPRYIPVFIDTWKRGAPVVVGARMQAEKRSLFRNISTKLFYFFINYASEVKISPDVMDFRLIDHEVVTYFKHFKERNRITRGLIDWLGYPQTHIPVQIPERAHGDSTYSTRMLFRLAKDSLVSMSLLPLKISGYLGIAIVVVMGPLGLFVLIDQSFLGDRLQISGAASLGILTAFMIGVVLINLGLVALYIANMHDQILGRPLFVRRKNVEIEQKTSKPTTTQPRAKPPSTHPEKVASILAAQDTVTQNPATSVESMPIAHESHVAKLNILAEADGLPKNILWFSWKDAGHPLAGGAELLTTELRERLVLDGHTVTLITSSFPGAVQEENIHGVRILRMGGRYTVHFKALLYYLRHRREFAPDLVVDEVNTAPFFAHWYTRKPTLLFFHQLSREIWYHEAPKFMSGIGYVAEAVYIRLLNRGRAITVSRSSRLDLLRHGFRMDNISIISEGVQLHPVPDPSLIRKYSQPTLLSIGAVRSMKQTLDQIEAFELAKSATPGLRLIIAGDISGAYGQKVHQYAEMSEYADDILILGSVSEKDKIELMQRSHWLLATSIKEGWGLVVTEAAGQGTPTIAYDADGLRDSVKDGVTGFLVHPTPESLGEVIIEVMQHGNELEAVAPNADDLIESLKKHKTASTYHIDYATMQRNAWEFARTITFERSYSDFLFSTEL